MICVGLVRVAVRLLLWRGAPFYVTISISRKKKGENKMLTKVYNEPRIFQIDVPLPDNPLRNLNCYVAVSYTHLGAKKISRFSV